MSVREDLIKLLDGEVFYPISTWPQYIRVLLQHTPISDTNTFKFIVFMYGNGCPPETCFRFLCSSYYYDKNKLSKRLQQIRWIILNLATKAYLWYYFDIHHQKTLFLTGNPKPPNQ